MMGEQISIIILMKDSGRMDWRQYRCSGLERNEAKVSRCVPRGERISNDPDLPDKKNSDEIVGYCRKNLLKPVKLRKKDVVKCISGKLNLESQVGNKQSNEFSTENFNTFLD